MYRTSSPIFDIPEFPTLRRIKPLPKHRRTVLNANLNSTSPTVTAGLLPSHPQGHHHAAYIGPGYNVHPHPPDQNHFETQSHSQAMLNAAGTLVSSALDALQSHTGLNLGFPLSNINADTTAVTGQAGTVSRVDDRGGGDGQDQLRQQQEHRRQLLMSTNPLSVPTTPPLPSGLPANNRDESHSQIHSYSGSTYTHTPEHNHRHEGDHEGSDGEEEVDSEGTEGDLQERLFLRAETDRLLAHADSLSARMALQSYYRSMGFGIPEFGSSISTSPIPPSGPGMDHGYSTLPNSTANSSGGVVLNGNGINLGTESGYVAVGVGGGHAEGLDGDGRGGGAGDYGDHSHQQGQGNTKKRKVPTNVGGSPPLHHHHHHNHYSSHRSVPGTLGSGYGNEVEAEAEEREAGLGFGFGLNLDAGVAAEEGSGTAMRGGESDIFGLLPGPTGPYSQVEASHSNHHLPHHQFHRKAKLSAVTLAGLQRKELIRSRKKQLEAVLGTVSNGDTWALDHALSVNFPPLLSSSPSVSSSTSASPTSTDSDHGLTRATANRVEIGAPKVNAPVGNGDNRGAWELGWGWSKGNMKEVKIKLSKRQKMRIARTARIGLGRLGRHPDAAPFPTGEFTFSSPSVTADRLATMQEEVANLRNLFGAEIARQTAKAGKTASGNDKVGKGAGGGSGSGKGGKKRAQQRARTIMNAKSGEQPAEFLEMPSKGQPEVPGQQQHQSQQANQQQAVQAPGTGPMQTPKKGKKKKRSALANASNPHHLRNYVPSRLPHSASGGAHIPAGQNASVNAFWPPPLRLLSAELPPKKRSSTRGGRQTNVNVQSLPQLVVPQEEWICAFCEYSLFYGDETEHRRAVRNRKKILRRRRRARERAAAAASGVNAAMKGAAGVSPVAEKTRAEVEEEEEEDGEDGPGYEPVAPSNVLSEGGVRLRAREPAG